GAAILTWTRGGNSVRFARVPLRQREVRVGEIAATLTMPQGAGPFPAVAMVHGSGPHGREEFQVFGAYCALLGIAVLADDKRGVGESRGTYPGEGGPPPPRDRPPPGAPGGGAQPPPPPRGRAARGAALRSK